MEASIQQIWKKYEIKNNDGIIIGVSGGVDSMVLLEILSRIHPRDKLFICHTDHCLREESKLDALFVKNYAKKKGIQYECSQVNIQEVVEKTKVSAEMAGREIRYAFFEKIRQSEKARFVITAHHKNDSIETVILNMCKGAKLRGLSGIQERQGTILRPLLGITKKEILAFAEKHDIPYRNDSTNQDVTFQRNRIRNNIIPEFEAINPEFITTFGKMIQYFKDLDHMMEGIVGVYLATKSIKEETFESMSPLLRHTFIEKMYASIKQTTIGLTTGNIEEIERYILTARGGTVKNIGPLRLEKKERKITWSENTKKN